MLFEEWYFGNKRSDFDPPHPHPTPFSLSLHCSCRKRETCDAGWLLVLERSRIRRGNALVRNVRVLQYFFLKKACCFLALFPPHDGLICAPQMPASDYFWKRACAVLHTSHAQRESFSAGEVSRSRTSLLCCSWFILITIVNWGCEVLHFIGKMDAFLTPRAYAIHRFGA